MSQHSRRTGPAPLSLPTARVLAAAGFLPVWLLLAVLVLAAAVLAQGTLSATSLGSQLPLMTFLAIAALGQMLVVMTGGIDLSVPGVMTMVGTVLLGVSGGTDDRVLVGVGGCLALAAAVGLVNGLLVGYAGLNPLVVTLSTGQIVLGVTTSLRSHLANETAVPPLMSSLAGDRVLGASLVFWLGAVLTVLVAVLLGRTTTGRRFQAVGANREAAWIAGIDVRRHTACGYVLAGLLYGVAGLLLAAFIRTPTLEAGAPYLLGPIAAVVIAGASLAGGQASALSTWAAAAALALLTQMLQVFGLPSALQYVVFGCVIAAGMVVSGDRIAAVAGHRTTVRATRAET
ncbi:MAG TPA: ABC transporter permease [Streptosporangiaceae bacterium]|nr:ABC transporter permease [Streptosporangiaceae bacterium]